MKRSHIIIYITGLRDKSVLLQTVAVKWWQIFRVQTKLFQVNWADAEPFNKKINRLLGLIDTYNNLDFKYLSRTKHYAGTYCFFLNTHIFSEKQS